MTYINAVKYILSLSCDDEHVGDGAAFERIRLVCDILGQTSKKPHVLHLCGDVGKDSCLRMLESILKLTPHKFGRFSPSDNDDPRLCISINEKPISHAEFSDAVKEISKLYKSRFPDVTPSRREIMTLIALKCFEANSCDLVMYEKCDSRNDPVNALDVPNLSVITPISDRQISLEKLESIVPKGTLETVSCLQHKEVYNAISDVCALSGSRLTVPIYSDVEIKSINLFKTLFSYRGVEYSVRSFSPCQTVNAITVIESANALRRIGVSISDEAIARGISISNLDGKCETLSIEPNVILSSSCEADRIDSLLASLAQLKDRFMQNIDVCLDRDCGIDPSVFSDSLSAYGIPHNFPTAVSPSELEHLLRDTEPSIPPEATVVFVGSKNYISSIKHALSDRFGF